MQRATSLVIYGMAFEGVSSGNRTDVLADGKILLVQPSSSPVPLFCSICLFPMKTMDDSVAFHKHGTCARCELWWSGSKFGSWQAGWRPSKETEGWDEYIQERKLLGRRLITLK